MTGEITLRGNVLPIGGLKEKILAAHRARITKVLIPMENKKDIEDIPKKILRRVELVPVENMDQVLAEALVLEKDEEIFTPEDQCKAFSIKDLQEPEKMSDSCITAH